MPQPLLHGLKFEQSRDAVARQDFVVGLRRYVLNDLADALRRRFEDQVTPAFEREHGRPFATQDEIHAAMLGNTTFQFYSAARYNAQEMSWRSVIPQLAEHLQEVKDTAAVLAANPRGSLKLDAGLTLPKNVADLDVHLMPGGYDSRDEILAGAVYDNGLTVFTAGLLGPHIDDIGQSMAHYVHDRFPGFAPGRILDCGCTIGHNTVPWAQCYPQAEVHGIDVAAASLRYGHARAESLGVPIHFRQMNATGMAFESDSMDLIFSSQFLHELSIKDIRRYLAEAWRVLRPGGLLLTMELPPNRLLAPYDQFYLDWDCYYNREPFYRAFRDAEATTLLASAAFDVTQYFQFTVPQYWRTSAQEFREQIARPAAFDDDTGRLSDGIRYFGFGCWK